MDTDSRKTVDDPMEVIMNPEYLERLRMDATHCGGMELTDAQIMELGECMANQSHASDSVLARIVRYVMEHPEKSVWYRNHVLFPSSDAKHFPEASDGGLPGWRVEIPILSMDF